jgi:hypothetical protein
LAGFFKNLINRVNDRFKQFNEGPGSQEPVEPPWTPGEPPPPPPPIDVPEEPSKYDQVSIYDDFGQYIGTNDWDGWWNATVYNTYASRVHVITLIGYIEDEYGADWDWKEWREAYAAAHAPA